MTYAEAQDYLFALRTIGSKFGLERMRALYAAAGSPGHAIPTLHVAGTNGKGSVCAMAEAILRANGHRTGLFTSPHLLRLGERVQINRQALGEAAIVRYVQELRPLCEAIAAGDMQNHPTFFELMTVIALLHFEREGCEVIVMETGLGGRLDSTNVLQPAVTAITSIGLDHQEILGSTLEAIAAEKAGIIKPGVPLVLGHLPAPAAAVIIRQAAALHAPVFASDDLFAETCTGEDQDHAAAASAASPAEVVLPVKTAPSLEAVSPPSPPSPLPSPSSPSPLPSSPSPLPSSRQPALPPQSLPLPEVSVLPPLRQPLLSQAEHERHLRRAYPQTSLSGSFQRRNAAVALLLCEQLQAVSGVRCDGIKALAALRSVEWAGRWQRLRLADHRELVLDASHNEEGARALEENLARFVQERGVRPVVITGALGQERARSLLAVIARYAARIILVEVSQPRACSLAQLQAAVAADFAGGVQSATVEELFLPGCLPGPALAQLADTGSLGNAPIVVTGSIYLIGEVLTQLHGELSTEAVRLQDKISG